MEINKFAALVARIKEQKARAALQQLITEQLPTHIDLSQLGLQEDWQDSAAGRESAIEVLSDIAEGMMSNDPQHTTSNIPINMLSSALSPIRNSDNSCTPTGNDSSVSLGEEVSNGQQDHRAITDSISSLSDRTEEQSVDTLEHGDIVLEQLNTIPTEPGDGRSLLGVAREITLNTKQQQFYDSVLNEKSTVLIGAAGTGKTTCMRQVTRGLIDSQIVKQLQASTKWLKIGNPGAAVLSFTNKAVNNIRHAVVPELRSHTITAHKLLEFQPVFYEVEKEDGNVGKTLRFEPARHKMNPLPSSLTLLAWEESSMIGVSLYNMVQEAMPHQHQEIFLGDIQQLPPVFGLAILGFKMLTLPVVELTEIYRQAAGSPIISLAHMILRGEKEKFSSASHKIKMPHPVTGKLQERKHWKALEELSKDTEFGQVTFQPWQKELESETALNVFAMQCQTWIKNGYFNPDEDIILCPFNKAFGTVEINKKIAQKLGTDRGAVVWEVQAGFQKHYLAVGDRVLYDKEDAEIISISHNGAYMGARTQLASEHLDRWGHYREKPSQEDTTRATSEAAKQQDQAIDDFFLDGNDYSSDGVDGKDRVNSASHVVVVKLRYAEEGDAEKEIALDSAAEINNLLGGYAITVHKAQGSEYDTVILCLHASHAMMVSRELLYTAVTRAKKKLHIICEPNTFEKGVMSQRIKGDSLEEKAEWFKGKQVKGSEEEFPLIKSVSAPSSFSTSREDTKPKTILQAYDTTVTKMLSNSSSMEDATITIEEIKRPMTIAERLAAAKAKINSAKQ